MKRVAIYVCALVLMAAVSVHAQDVKIKKGKVTMTEAQYDELLQKASMADKLQKELEFCNQQLEIIQAPESINTFNDSASYAIGRDIFMQWNQQSLGINGKMAGQAMIDCANGRVRIYEKEARPLLDRFQRNFEQERSNKLQANIIAGEKFLEEMDDHKSVSRTKSGIRYRVVKQGNGKRPKATDRVKVHYTGKLIDGTKFDSSIDRGEPITFPLNQVIPGWSEGVQLMDEGATYMLYIPYNLAYGEQEIGNIPAGSTLIFEIELLEINPKE